MALKWDGHTHTKFCYHGSPAESEAYLDRAIELGFARYTLSEHPPLPDRYVDDPKLMAELAMPERELPEYMAYAAAVKARYADRIEVAVGLEMDYLPGMTDYSDRLIAPWLGELEDIVVSVHYLPGKGGMRCIDFTPTDFADAFLDHYGSMDAVAEAYYDAVEGAIAWASTLPGSIRRRIGHVNLIRKFQRELPPMNAERARARLEALLPKLKAAGVGLDVNVSGFRKPTCGEAYVPEWLIDRCIAEGIELVYGSDTHKPAEVGADWDWFERAIAQGGAR
ncbi:histidinol-phosphatase HisJ [Cohnella hashimotonis]|uniref:Histidinol-phosphatase n=1 Tax=Cohnella hashimotonis TaxID=2826895 RepID=A0ABT6TAZ4_9BACL|nr:histidinol-phosphatase HisJ [Cohnella hashimotonis]MDI4644013.1 histidinol-phosphatase HisJ [Cohnella hashimotonis]